VLLGGLLPPVFTQVRGISFLRTSPFGDSANFAFGASRKCALKEFHAVHGSNVSPIGDIRPFRGGAMLNFAVTEFSQVRGAKLGLTVSKLKTFGGVHAIRRAKHRVGRR
jgi:hypothetical protein